MPKLTMIVGSLLMLEGVSFYLGTGMTSVTSLIPSFFGSTIAITGIYG